MMIKYNKFVELFVKWLEVLLRLLEKFICIYKSCLCVYGLVLIFGLSNGGFFYGGFCNVLWWGLY